MSVFIPISKKAMPKNVQTTTQLIALISCTSKIMLKILQAKLQQYKIQKFQMYKLDLEKAEEQVIKLPTQLDHRESKGT